ncbi:flagellar biosynthetic protein FliR [Vreelandella jeotgali]|uniref:flagellar biosynthetic protein FliR n=1 Tax=Vreelandella jeotgali TaxID=553386 RepID=UPI00034CBEC4|nr:flagellar biosynthetic protein FliR [Halomonas jeotgali]
MIEVTFAQLQGWLVAFLWPFARITAFMAMAPLWGHSSVPNRVKVGLAGVISIIIAPVLPAMPEAPIMSWASVGIIIEQIVVGLAFGFVMRIIFAVVQASGEFIGLQMGLAFASFFDAASGTNIMVLSRILYMITLLMFVALNGHLMVLETLVMSFQTLPIGMDMLNANAFEILARYAGTVFASGMLLALPLVGSLLIINLALGILNRSAPQLTVFNIGFPSSLTVGMTLFMVLMTHLGDFLERLFSQGLEFMQGLIELLAQVN